MANNIALIVFPTKDLAKAKAFYSTFLGVEPYVDGGYYVGYNVGELEIGLDPHGSQVINYIDTDDIEGSLTVLRQLGAEMVKDSTDVGGGLLIAQVELEGNVLGLRQPVK
jgi:predicted enzyme related to lactoylglutathione lyase